MLADKTVHYVGRNTDLGVLSDNVVRYLREDGFKTQTTRPTVGGMLIQAQKGGFLRELITSERAFNILIRGEPNDFTVRVGIGKWVQNIAVATVETLLISELFLPLDVAEMAWNVEVENKLLRKIDEFVAGPRVLEVPGTAPPVEGTVARITGAHKLIVEPHPDDPAVKVGDEVMIVSSDVAVTLGTVRERVVTPYPSNLGIVVRANRPLERCNVNVGGTQLQAVGPTGESSSEFALAVNGMVTFRIPETLSVETDSIVEVKDGTISIKRETFGTIGPLPAMPPTR
jgi:hypothetical protein